MSSSIHMRLAVGGFVAAICLGAVAQVQPQSQPVPVPGTQPAATQPTTGPAPQMEITPKEFDFGDVWQGAPTKRVFTIKNAGSAELTLSTKSSCGCTVATKPKSPLPAGESTTFEITYDTKGIGKAAKKVTVITNDPVQPNFDINVTGTVKPLVAMTPADRVKFDELEPATIATQTLRLENKFERPLLLKLKDGQDFGRFDVTLTEIKAGVEYELTATTKPPLTKGWNHARVALETGSEVLPTIIVPVQANVQPRILAFPDMIAVTPDMVQPTQKSVSVDYRKETPVEITDIKASLDALKWERVPDEAVQPAGKRGSHKVLVTLPAYADLPADGATLEISTNDKDPQYQTLTVRILKVNKAAPPRKVDPNSVQQVAPMPPGKLSGGGR